MHVAEQVVAVLDAHARHRIIGRPRQIGARKLLEHFAVVDKRRRTVCSHHVSQVEPLAQLHARHVARRAHEVAAVIHVDVQVAAVPALG